MAYMSAATVCRLEAGAPSEYDAYAKNWRAPGCNRLARGAHACDTVGKGSGL